MPDRNAFTDAPETGAADKAATTSSDEAMSRAFAGDGPSGPASTLRSRDVDLTMGWLEAWIVPLA